MPNLFIIDIICTRVAANYNKMRKLILKLRKSSSSVGFIKKSLFNNITPTFAKVKVTAPDLLKALAILSDTTGRRSAVDREDLKSYWK